MAKPANITALIDGDMVAFRVAAGCDTVIAWDDLIYSTHIDIETAQRLIRNEVERIMEATGADAVRFAVSARRNFRYDLYPEYKGNRKGTRKPTGLGDLLQFGIDTFNGFRKDGLEADDILGIWQTRSPKGSTVIVSGDKDLRTVPGKHYNPLKPGEGITTVSQAQADRTHMLQTLTGDTVDNIPGCPKCGPVTAEKILPPLGTHLVDLWEAVVDHYIKMGLAPEHALLNARLTRILQSSDYDFETGTVIYWEPPQ